MLYPADRGSISGALPGDWGKRETKYLFQETTETKIYKLGEHGNKGNFRGTGNIGNEDLDFGEHGNKAMYFRRTME